MIPSAKIDACEKAPPENMSRSCINPSAVKFFNASSSSGLIPGKTT